MTPRPLEEVVKSLIKRFDTGLIETADDYHSRLIEALINELRASLAEREKEGVGMKVFSNSSWVGSYVYVDSPSSDPTLIKSRLTAEEMDKDIVS